MGILKKSTPKKSETRILPSSHGGTVPFVKTSMPDEAGYSGDGPGDGDNAGKLSVDVFQTADEIVVVAPVSGVTIDDLFIDITEGVLTISGRRNLEFSVSQSDYFIQECFWGNFTRSVILPEDIDAAAVSASFKDGILTVRIPKIEKVHTRMVEIREE